MDDVLFQCHHVFPGEGNYFSRWEAYSAHNLLEPELLSSINLPNDRIVNKAFFHNQHYYFVEYHDVVKMCVDLTAMNLQPATEDNEHFDYVWDANLYDDHLFLTAYQGDFLSLFVYSFQEDGTLSLNNEYPLDYTVNSSAVFNDAEIIYTGFSDIEEHSIIRFQWQNEELTNREDFQLNITATSLNLMKSDVEYLAFTRSEIYRLDQDFQQQTIISESTYYWAQEVLMDRYIVMLADSDRDIYDFVYHIFDIETHTFLPFESEGFVSIQKQRYSQDYLIFEHTSFVKIVRLGDNGIESIANLSMPANYNTFEMFDNVACISQIVDSELIYKFYRIEGDQLIFLNEFDPDYPTNTCMFLDPHHIVIIENYIYHPGYYYYRIENDFSLTEIMFVPGEMEIYATESMIAPSGTGLSPLNFTDPDTPSLWDALTLPGYQYLDNYMVSYNGQSHYMYSDSYFNTYITDNRFNVLHHWQDSYAFFLDGNNIVLNDGSSVVLAQVNGLDSDEETIPPKVNSLVMHPNHPNPFNPTTTISFDLPQRCHVRLEIYNIKGQRVDTLLDEVMDTGNHRIVWQPQNKASGVYLSRLRTGRDERVRKMILLK